MTVTTDGRTTRRAPAGLGPGDPSPANLEDARAGWDGNGSRALRSPGDRGQRPQPARVPASGPCTLEMGRS
jgi:hypothetical protein